MPPTLPVAPGYRPIVEKTIFMATETEFWNAIAACLDAFFSRPQPANIEEFVPPHGQAHRSLAMIELAKADMELAWARGEKLGVKHYLSRFPELQLCTGGAPFELVVEELRLRKQFDTCDPQEFLSAFPQHASLLEQLLSIHETIVPSLTWRLTISPRLHPGEMIEDFELLRLLGKGAFAEVFLAKQASMNRLVALKISEDCGDEPQTLSQLDHPHIVRVFDVRRLPPLRLLSMQYAPGGTLQQLVRSLAHLNLNDLNGGSLLASIDEQLLSAGLPAPEDSPRRALVANSTWTTAVCDIAIQLASALHYAHERRVLHRDIKPANILLTAEANCKLADFNVSFSEELQGADAARFFGGSLLYMSPEQLGAMQIQPLLLPSELDHRSDVYSLACVIWELLTLRRPWPNDAARVDWDATVQAIRDNRLCRAPQLPLGMFPSAEMARMLQTLRRALEFDRSTRIQSAAELAMELRICVSPQAWRLFHPEDSRWGRLACRLPIVVSAAAVILPNALAGAFNYHYNLAWLTARYPASHATFIEVSVLLNGVAFTLGSVLFLSIVGPVAQKIAERKRNPVSPVSDSAGSLSLGDRAARISLCLWLAFGLLFPLLLWWRLPEFDRADAVHFFLSLAICGAIAAAYPFLLMSLIELEYWLGATLGKRSPAQLANQADGLTAGAGRYLLVAAGVPLLGISLLLTQSTPVRPALLALVAAGVVGLFFAYWVHGRIQNTLEVVKEALK
jgi:eukaryotic-like serine/threonine-protein kinase